ncbi:MAG: hypothetical protein JOY62_13060 [Acidobacteriaceae bacterium]|nr:hypothetical protein [Acidobacteriaceae bacterium]MBV9780890.1 hypothetical protein [Acidobacteriaceae bacterium]
MKKWRYLLLPALTAVCNLELKTIAANAEGAAYAAQAASAAVELDRNGDDHRSAVCGNYNLIEAITPEIAGSDKRRS